MLMLVRSAAALATMRPVLHMNTAFMLGGFNFLTLTNPADPAGTCFPNWHPCTKDVRTAEVIPEPGRGGSRADSRQRERWHPDDRIPQPIHFGADELLRKL